MKQYLLDTFAFNDHANRQLISKIALIPEPAEAIRFMSHLANSQLKWMARIQQDPNAPAMSWWDPTYRLSELEAAWERSLAPWLRYIQTHSDSELAQPLTYIGYDGGPWACSPLDIALQLNYHSIHHRAQIQTILRTQGIEPDFVDYIGTRQRKLDH